MEIFVLTGAGHRIARTSISLVLALGLARRGLNPLHIQVLSAEEAAPALSQAEHAPFTNVALAPVDAGPTGFGILHLAMAHGDFGPVVIDLPGADVPARLLGCRHCHFVLPMATDRPDIRRLVKDFARLAGRNALSGNNSVVVVPVGWPAVLKQTDYQRLLKREAAGASSRTSPSVRDIVGIGLSDVVLGLGPLLIDGAVNPSPSLGNAAAAIARAVLQATGSSYIAKDPTWSIRGL